MNNKTLVIHTDKQTDISKAIVVAEKDVIHRTKELLQKLMKKHDKANVEVYTPVRVVLKATDDEKNFAVAYEREKFVIVAPKGTETDARAYGNWEEAINFIKRTLSCAKTSNLILAQYRDTSL
jgi:hypothetical protein